MKKIHMLACLIAFILMAPSFEAEADDVHPLMTSKYWGNLGVYFSERDFSASAEGSVAGITRNLDFESSTGLDDSPDLFIAELGWQFTPNWGLALQYFESNRSSSRTLSDSIEWQDLVFDVGVRVDAESSMEITRLFFARRFRDKGPHSLRLGAGIHWLSMGASLAGEATLGDLSKEFRRSIVKTDLPMPNIGVWYGYSPSRMWMFNLRADWLSASVDEYKGGIWNAVAGVNFSPWDHVGLGLSYQFFQLDGTVKEDRWRGEIQTTFTGPVVYISGYW
jgi:opacity protein-like surface antigen